MSVRLSIPGQPTTWLPVPPEAIPLAIARCDELSGAILSARVFGFLDPAPIRASWYPGGLHGHLTTTIYDCSAWRKRTAASIQWRWATLWEADDWYEVGWHPDSTYFALEPDWAARIWRALNGNKRRRP